MDVPSPRTWSTACEGVSVFALEELQGISSGEVLCLWCHESNLDWRQERAGLVDHT